MYEGPEKTVSLYMLGLLKQDWLNSAQAVIFFGLPRKSASSTQPHWGEEESNHFKWAKHIFYSEEKIKVSRKSPFEFSDPLTAGSC